MAESRKIRIGISSCLLGQEVRYNGGHKRDSFLTEVFGRYVEWVPVCPEVEVGLGVPRPPIRLERIGGEESVRLVMPTTGADLTAAMTSYAERRVEALAGLELGGYVLKKDSPSCGMERVKVYQERGMAVRDGRGTFAEVLLRCLPHLPVEEEGRLNDPLLREGFVSRVFVYDRWTEGERSGWTRAALMRFHERHKFLLMARNQAGMRRLGRLLGEAGRGDDPADLARVYLEGLTAVMRRPRHPPRAYQRPAPPARLPLQWYRPRRPGGSGRHHRALPLRARAADRAAHPDPPPRTAARRRISEGPGLPRAPPARADAAEPRLIPPCIASRR